jgi:hypothetical protein
LHERLLSQLADRHLQILEIKAREEGAFNGGERLGPYNNSARVRTDVSNRNAVGFDDEIKISRTKQGNPLVPLNTRGNTCGIDGTRRKG